MDGRLYIGLITSQSNFYASLTMSDPEGQVASLVSA